MLSIYESSLMSAFNLDNLRIVIEGTQVCLLWHNTQHATT